RIRVSRSRALFASFVASIRSRSARQGPSFGSGWTSRAYSKQVAPERSTLRTVLCDTFSSRTISLIGLPLTKYSRRTHPIVSTPSIPRHPLAFPKRVACATHCKEGVKVGRRLPLYRGESSTPKHKRGRHSGFRGRGRCCFRLPLPRQLLRISNLRWGHL